MHFEVISEPNSITRCFFMVCCVLVRCQNSTIDDQRVLMIIGKVFESDEYLTEDSNFI